MRHLFSAIILIAGILGLTGPSAAKVVKFEIERIESPAFEGRTFGRIGTYDRIVAHATIAVSPDDPRNKIIVDLDRATRNAQGSVEAVADVEILRPTVAANGNRGLFYEVLNRGGKLTAWKQFTDAVMDPKNWGMARSITHAMVSDGVDLADQDAVDSWIARYNLRVGAGRPDDEELEDFDLDDDLDLDEFANRRLFRWGSFLLRDAGPQGQRAAVRHGISCVDRKIQEHLLHLSGIALKRQPMG